ncbi:MAG: leucyl/phenylalanyl-tRNA--protein transferase [Pseudomonadota bacterium]
MTGPLSPDLLLLGYQSGVFPMSESRTDTDIFWVDPKRRGVFDLAKFHVSRSLARRLRKADYQATIDQDFAGVVQACADRDETWINASIERTYLDLFRAGFAHSQEIWQDDHLVGGVYGVAIGGAFFGESMFSHATDGSKLALAYLIHRLRAAGFSLFDTQFLTPHLASLGAEEISRKAYQSKLRKALLLEADFCAPHVPRPDELLSDLKGPSGLQQTRD